ncbi:MAG TPA: 3-keto-5-aminohexanoate cleavage protein [Acetobacteraceae bacterium]|nr:3-keto-5-aminohexanoate cleavage protein [Acetobacteraceae bacterium]
MFGRGTTRGARVPKVIISCAITGAIATPSMSDALPITPEQIARSSIEAAEAGAAIIHLHARDPNTGEPTPDPAMFMRFLPIIKQSTDAVLNITTGGGLKMTVEERLAAPMAAKPEMCSLNMGSMNFNISAAGEKRTEWKYAWEREYLARTVDHIFRNTFGDVARIVEIMGKGHGARFEFECYDVGHLYNLAHCLDKKIVEPPLFVQTIFGILGGIGAEPSNLMFMRETADRLFGKDYSWSVLAAGRHQMGFCTMAGILGGNVRVGLEDSLYIGRGKLAKSNAEQVTKIRRILEDLSLEIATPAEARQMLKLKGGDRVGF